MSFAIGVVLVFVACFAISGAVFAPFPRENIVIYNYHGDVEAGTIGPTPYASRFGVEAKLVLKHDTSDPSLENAYYAGLSDIAISMYNGRIEDYNRTKSFIPISDSTNAIRQPFLIVYDKDGKLQGVKISASEAGWSKNMKMAIASFLQLDWSRIKSVEPFKTRSFLSQENTIHGDCSVTYDVHAKHQIHPNDTKFIVKTYFSPADCDSNVFNRPVHVFDHVESEGCRTEKEELLNVASKRYIEIEKKEKNTLIKKVITHGSHEYVPWNVRSEAQYVLTNTTFTLHDLIPVNALKLRSMNFVDIPITRNIIYQKAQGHYGIDAAVDVTQGRHVVDKQIIESELKLLLNDAANYLEEDHLYTNRSDRVRGQTINRILKTMGYMEVESFQRIFEFYKDPINVKEVSIKNIFVEMIPQVGTTASSLFALELIRENKLDNTSAIVMLFKLPLNVREPSYELLSKMSDLKELNQEIHVEIRKVGILSFATLVGRTFKKNWLSNGTAFSLATYLEDIYEHVNHEADYRMKIVYLMALKNVGLRETCHYLKLINKEELKVSKNPIHFRLLSIWSIDSDECYAPNLLWSVMVNQSLPIKLRIAAYEILMHRARSSADVKRIHSFMVDESNKHLYNYHYTTIQGIANSFDPCKLELREYVRKIIRFTRIPHTVAYPLSSEYSFDYKDDKYNYAEKFRVGIILDDVTGVPEVLHFKNVFTDARKPINNFEIRVYVEGIDKIKDLLNAGPSLPDDTKAKILHMLKEFRTNRPTLKDFHIDIVFSQKGRVVFFFHYNEELWREMWEEIFNAIIEAIMKAMMAKLTGEPIEPYKPPIHRDDKNIQIIDYDYHYEEQRMTDMGLPIILETQIPVLASVRGKMKISGNTINIEFDGRIWRHGEYAMSVYNPLTDTWHAIRKSTATDIIIPINTDMVWNKQSKNATISFPKILDRNASVGGFRIHSKTSVTVDEGDGERLAILCPTCRHHEDVRFGILEEKDHQTTIDSEDIGLQYTMSLFDCDNGITPISLAAEFRRAFQSEGKNDWNNWIIRTHMSMRQQLKNMMLSPQVGSCGYLLRIMPNEHAISRIELSKGATEKPLDGQKFHWTLIADMIAASSKKSARVWELDMSVDVFDRSIKDLYIHLSRKTQEKNDFKLAIKTHRQYKTYEGWALLSNGSALQHKFICDFAYSDKDAISKDHYYTIAMTLSSEWSNEQIEQMNKDLENGACAQDIRNPLYAGPNNSYPIKTLNCLNLFIRWTTLMKYNLYIDEIRLPDFVTIPRQYVEEFILSHLQPNLRFTNDASVNSSIEMIVHNEAVDISVRTSTRSYDLINVPFGNPRFTGFGPVSYPVWYFPLQNVQFDMLELSKYTTNRIRICTIFPQIVMTGDGQIVSSNMTGNWAVISSDYISNNYAIIGKMIGSNMAVKVYTSNSEIELVPGDDGISGRVILDGTELQNLPKVDALRLFDFTMTGNIKAWNNDIIVPMENNRLFIIYGINHVALAIDADFQGKVSGLCGSLNGLDVPSTSPDDQETNQELGELHTM